jgi:hypothetical protein
MQEGKFSRFHQTTTDYLKKYTNLYVMPPVFFWGAVQGSFIDRVLSAIARHQVGTVSWLGARASGSVPTNPEI